MQFFIFTAGLPIYTLLGSVDLITLQAAPTILFSAIIIVSLIVVLNPINELCFTIALPPIVTE